ncbi:MAG: HD domain-containing protein [Treponema sp.]|nr:HD domain-containing protein [Treponema sp.]
MNRIKIPKELKQMNTIFKNAGYEAYLVGGAVRDVILKKEASDWDLATNAHPEDVKRLFKKVIPTGIAHGTVTVLFMNKEIEVTTYRADQGYSDGRHPDKITYAKTIEDDLSRRDFTMNAIAANLNNGKLVDPFKGKKDIKKKIIRTVGNPKDRFLEDGLRPIRALRFASQLSFCIEKDTYKAIFEKEIKDKIKSISIERFRDEFEKILKSEKPSIGLKLMEETGVLNLFIPELAECKNITQADSRGFHQFDILDHNIYACDGAPKNKLNVRLAALFHDIGKKDTRTESFIENPNSAEKLLIIHFLKHELKSEKITRNILFRLKFPNSIIDNVCHLVKEHMFYYQSNWTDAAVRRFIVKIGAENFEDLFDLRIADIYGMNNQKVLPNSETIKNLNELTERINKVNKENTALSLKDLKINGNDLIALGVKPGKKIGIILNQLFQTVLDDPTQNNKEKLIEIASNLIN